MEWTYLNKQLDENLLEEYVGFVYEITNLTNNRKYIGKKLFKFSKSRKLKGQIRRKRFKVESDWKTYYGSNKELQTDVLQLGEENFKRTILRLCKTKAECSYFEAKYQFQYDVLLFPELYYNSWISVKVHGATIKNVKSIDLSQKL